MGDTLGEIPGQAPQHVRRARGSRQRVNEFIASTAAAVEEQSIVTQDMSSNMQRASAELS